MHETSDEIADAAAHWAIRKDEGPLSPADQQLLNAWLSADIRRRGALLRAETVLMETKRLKVFGSQLNCEFVDLPSQAMKQNRFKISRRAALIGGGSLAASVLLSMGIWKSFSIYTTRKGEVRLIPLPDGSRMTMNTATAARVHFDSIERKIELSDGEALFDVAKDKARPFEVLARGTVIRAIGTSFNVRNVKGRPLEITVREGTVQVERQNRIVSTLTANMRITATPEVMGRASAVGPSELTRELAWREGMLAFEDRPLSEIIEEFARYNDASIALSDPTLGKETVSGVFAANDPLGFASAAALSLGLQVNQTPGGVVLSR